MTKPARYTPLAVQPARTDVSQATAVEQSRAIAQVHAAIIVAQQCPRDMERATAEMQDVCARTSMAERAFYAVPNRGSGPTVHLMRELARIWGNIEYGVNELHRDDDEARSEVQAFAHDLQTNTRSSRTFQSPHARMAGGERKKLIDPSDIYLSNQNVGARAVRECIENVLPKWFAEEAQTRCRRTLEHGDGVPLDERRQKMITAYRGIGIKVDQLEAKIGRGRGTWTAADVAQMGILFTSITRDGLNKDEEFPPAGLSAADINAAKSVQAEDKPRRFYREKQAAATDPGPASASSETSAPVEGEDET